MKSKIQLLGQNKSQWIIGVGLSCLCSTAFSISPLKDDVLTQSVDQDEIGTVTPVVITAVKYDVQSSVEQQNQRNNQLAIQQSNAIKKDHLSYVVLNHYEQQKQESNPYQKQLDKKPLLPNTAKRTEYAPSVQNSMITVTTTDKVTIYVGRDAH